MAPARRRGGVDRVVRRGVVELMPDLFAAMLAIALAAPGPYAPPGRGEPDEERAARVATIAVAAADAAEGPEAEGWPWDAATLAVAALTVTYHESGRWDARVHARPWSPDVRGRAACLGQLHVTTWVPLAEWRTLAGTDWDATHRCLATVVRVLSRHAARCRLGTRPSQWGVARVLAAYGMGRCTRTPPTWALMRSRQWVSWMARI